MIETSSLASFNRGGVSLDRIRVAAFTYTLERHGVSDPRRLGLAHLFSVMMFADDHGVAKPDRRLYEIADVLEARRHSPCSGGSGPQARVESSWPRSSHAVAS